MQRIGKYLWTLKSLFIKPDEILIIKPTMRCNLGCFYCVVNIAHGGRPPIYDECSPEFWVDMIKDTSKKMLVISGGEPGIYKGLAKIVNAAIEKKMLIRIFTNLSTINEFLSIKDSWRVIYLATYHYLGGYCKFMDNYDILSKRFHIAVREIEARRLPFSKVVEMATEQTDRYQLIYAPDGRLFTSCKDLDEGGR